MNEETVFHQAKTLPVSQRAAFLDQACGSDAALRRRIESLLHAHENPGSFMAAPVADAALALNREARRESSDNAEATQADGPAAEPVGQMIGRYKLLQRIGEGGFGTVYMAEQQTPVRRRVALKIIKLGMDTRAVITRFEAERQALAMMDHPNIARVLDAGSTDSGRPYFVMELVKGIPITEYCDQASLNMRQRLELFMDVCRAVQHAHQKGVIHRDLKPSNIMVTLRDDKPNVKVIDFGIAKATDQNLTEKTLFTAYGQMIGTPVYMSPEQAVLSEFDVDTRSDVYSLGVLLYELLTGSPPFDALTLRRAGFDEMRRIIREQQPQKPSTRLSTLSQDVQLTVANQRQVSAQVLCRQLHGDLDWIILKAIEKDRARRYESASAFAQDIERHLKSEPVMAAAPSTGYKLRKFMQRNKGSMSAAATIALLLLAGTVISTWQAIRATKAKGVAVTAVAEKDKALVLANAANEQSQKRLAQIEKANDILGSIFENLDPKEIAKHERPLQAILVEKLNEAVEQLEGESIGDPLVVAAMQVKFGRSLTSLGEPRKAIVLLDKARATFKSTQGLEGRDTLTIMGDLAVAYLHAGKLELALPLYEETLKLQRTKLGQEDRETLVTMNNLATAYQQARKPDLALPLYEQTLKFETAKLGPEHPDMFTTMNNLATAYQEVGKLDLALPLYKETLRLQTEKLGAEHPDTLMTMGNLAMAYQDAGKSELALPLLMKTFELRKARLGPEHPDTLMTMGNLAMAYQDAGKPDVALPLFEETFKLQKVRQGPNHPDTLHVMGNLAHAYQAAGKMDLALPLYEETLKLEKATLGLGNPDTLTTMNNLAVAYQSSGRLDLALPLSEETVKLEKAALGPNHRETLISMGNVALNYHITGKYDVAIPLFEETLQRMKATLPFDHPNMIQCMGNLAEAYLAAGKLEQARELGEATLKLRRAKLGAEHSETLACLANLGSTLLKLKAFTEAEPILRECLAGRQKTQANVWTKFNAESMLGGALLGQKRYADAEPLLLAGYEGLLQRGAKIPQEGKTNLPDALERLIALYESRGGEGDAEKAAIYRTSNEWLARLRNSGFKINVLKRLEDGTWEVNLDRSAITDLTILSGAPISSLSLGGTAVSDLTPLRGMPLKRLVLWVTKVTDVSPLKGMRLQELQLQETKVADLSVLRGMPLVELWLHHCTKIVDLSAIEDATALKVVTLPPNAKNIEFLRAFKIVELSYEINSSFRPDKTAVEFWQERDATKK